MHSSDQFNGLLMPVFSAFGWAEEEAAINYALSQLELFIDALYFSLPRETQAQFPAHGLDRVGRSAYLAAAETPESGLHIAFLARPMSLEISMALLDKAALTKAYKAATARTETFCRLLADLGPDWNLRLQQMEYDDETGAAVHYQDLFKDGADKLDAEAAAELLETAAYRNGEEKWVVHIYVSRRQDSEKVAAMGMAVVTETAGEVDNLLPLARFLTGQTRKTKVKAKPKEERPVQPKIVPEQTEIAKPSDASELDRFSFIGELRSLHVRRGFINLTPNHWPFFAINARTETRDVTVKYNGKSDKKCSVWRLVPSDQARVVLSPTVHEWLEENFAPDDQIYVEAIKSSDAEITITLSTID